MDQRKSPSGDGDGRAQPAKPSTTGGRGRESGSRATREQAARETRAPTHSGGNFLSPGATTLDRVPSLHGLHAQSSTETSGLGETIASGFSSQESIHSLRGGAARDIGGHSLTPEEAAERAERVRARMARGSGGDSGRSTRPGPPPRVTDVTAMPSMRADHGQRMTVQNGAPGRLVPPGADPPDPKCIPSLCVEQIDYEWEKRSSRGSMRSRSSKGGSFRSRAGSQKKKFLGRSTESKWMKWSRDRQASFRRRMELIDKSDKEKETRLSTPIKKARQECLKLVHPDLERKYLSEDDLNELRRHHQQRMRAHHVIEKSKKKKYDQHKITTQLTEVQWAIVREYWDRTLFNRCRYVGVFISFIVILLMIVSITNSAWVYYEMTSPHANLTLYEGFWLNCSTPINRPELAPTCRRTNYRDWQNAVIGLMIFAAAFGFLASVLSVCGVCTSPLPKKIYYFHSAGEIFLICAISTSVALVIFPVAIEMDTTIHSHRYGTGYGLGWGAAFFFFAAALCMSLDELVREASRSKCCRWCWKSKQTDRTELRQV